MKCPVCNIELENNETSCNNCGFNRIRSEFVNKEDMQVWQSDTVEQCKAIYHTMRIKLLECKVDNLSTKLDQIINLLKSEPSTEVSQKFSKIEDDDLPF